MHVHIVLLFIGRVLGSVSNQYFIQIIINKNTGVVLLVCLLYGNNTLLNPQANITNFLCLMFHVLYYLSVYLHQTWDIFPHTDEIVATQSTSYAARSLFVDPVEAAIL